MNLEQAIERVCKEIHLPMINAQFGKDGVEAAFHLMETARALYRHLELERVTGRIVIFELIGKRGSSAAGQGLRADFASLANRTVTDLVIEVDANGVPYLRQGLDLTIERLAENAVVYHWHGNDEEFLAGADKKTVIRVDSVARSQFAVPTLETLREALQRYAVENIRESTCYIFNEAWSDNSTRIFLKAGPEATMRNSLTQFLRNRIGSDHEVWPEQNVDESHPVDIQVKPRFTSNRVMLIEIKWLGWSVADDGHVTVRYSQSRAQSGANQLADYLDEKRRFAPTNVIHGYLVVIDCRRKNLSQGVTTISREDGLHFEDQELVFDPAHHSTRVDFDPPYRMFARPVCCD
jgi:hypothetical protein